MAGPYPGKLREVLLGLWQECCNWVVMLVLDGDAWLPLPSLWRAKSSLVLSGGFISHREKQEQIAVLYSFMHSFVHLSVICLSVLQFPAQLSRHA